MASLEYEMAKRRGDARESWHPGTEMGRTHLSSSRDIRKLVAENHPELAEEANREFIEKYAGKKNAAAAEVVAGFTDNTIKENKERLQRENIRQRVELDRKQKELIRKQTAQGKAENDLKKIQRLDEINRGLNATHRGHISGVASQEMKSLRALNAELKNALTNAGGNVNAPEVLDAMFNAYKASLNYETLKRNNDTSPDWQPKTRMGNERMEASRKLREFVIEHCPDIAQRAAQEFAMENRGRKYGKTADAVAKADRDAISLSLKKQQLDFKKAEVELDIREEELSRRSVDIKLRKNDLDLSRLQEEVRRQRLADEAARKQEFNDMHNGLYAKHKGFMTGKASDEMKELRQASYGMDHAVSSADGNLNDPRAESAMITAYKASMKYELLKRKNDAGASWTPGTNMGKSRMESARALREYVAKKRPDLAEKANQEFLRENRNSRYKDSLNAVVNSTKPFIKAGYEEKQKRTEMPNQTEFEARREHIARQRSMIESGLMNCERVRAQITGVSSGISQEKKKEFDRQQAELDKQKAALLRRQGELELRPDAEVPQIQVRPVNQAPAVKENEPEAKAGQREAEAGGIRNAEEIQDPENAVIKNNEVVEKGAEGNPVRQEAEDHNDIGNLDYVEIIDDETNEVIEVIGGPEPEKEAKEAPQEKELGQEAIENINNEPEKNEEELELENTDPKDIEEKIDKLGQEDNLSLHEEAPQKAAKEQEQPMKRVEAHPEQAEPEKEPAKAEPEKEPAKAEPEKEPAKAEPQKQPAKAEPEKEPAKAEPQKQPAKAKLEKKSEKKPEKKPKTVEQERYEKQLSQEKEVLMDKLSAIAESREKGLPVNREEYRKTVSEVLAVEKLSNLYEEKGQMFVKTVSDQKALYAGFNEKDAHFDRFTSMREPRQLLERMNRDQSLSEEMGKEKYNPALSLKGFVKQYKGRELWRMSKLEFEEMVQDSKTIMREDIRRSAGKVTEEAMNGKLAVYSSFNAISPTDPKTGRLKESGMINKLRKYRVDLEEIVGEEGLSSSINNPEFKALLSEYGTEELTRMALEGDGQKLASKLIRTGIKQKSEQKGYAKQRESASELQLQPKPEMGMKKK